MLFALLLTSGGFVFWFLVWRKVKSRHCYRFSAEIDYVESDHVLPGTIYSEVRISMISVDVTNYDVNEAFSHIFQGGERVKCYDLKKMWVLVGSLFRISHISWSKIKKKKCGFRLLYAQEFPGSTDEEKYPNSKRLKCSSTSSPSQLVLFGDLIIP